MTKQYPYIVDLVASIVLAVLASALIVVSQTGPEGPTVTPTRLQQGTLIGMLILVLALVLAWQGIRRRPLLKKGFPPKPWYMFGLFWFWLLLAFVEGNPVGSAAALTRLLYFALAMYCLAVAIGVKWPSQTPAESA